MTLIFFDSCLGKTPFGLLLPFCLTLPAWGQYFRLQFYRTYVYNWIFIYLRPSSNYNTELFSTGGLEEAPVRLGYVRLANTVPRFQTGGTGAKPLLGSAITVPRLPTGGAGAKPLLGSVITVPWLPTGGAGAKTLLGSANTVQCQVRFG